MRSLALLIPALFLAACNQSEEAKSPEQASTTAAPAASPVAVASATAAPAVARKVSEDSDLYTFDYGYPAAAAAIPSLKAMLDADLDKQKGELTSEAEEAKADAAKNDFPYRTYSRGFDWQVVTETPGWLSLSSMVSTYTGGAHPNYWFDTILWDKAANKRRDPKDLFASKEALAKAIQPEFCRQIDKQRAKKRGEPVKRGSDDPFAQCLDPTDYVVILGSSNRQAIDRIGVLVPPYEAGPYAEGAYEVTLPVTPAILAVVKPEFRSSFAASR
jgi:hypothetical protein